MQHKRYKIKLYNLLIKLKLKDHRMVIIIICQCNNSFKLFKILVFVVYFKYTYIEL